MNNQWHPPPERSDDEWEKIVREAAHRFPYPATPDIAAALRQKRRSRRLNPVWRVALAIILIALILTLAVPQVRAVVLEFIQIGAVRIFPLEPTATPFPGTPTVRPASSGQPTPVASVLDLPGETTLADARAKSGFDFGLPPYFGAPDHVFLQDHHGYLVTLVWVAPAQPKQVRLVMEILNDQLVVSKFTSMDGSKNVVVNGDTSALWLPDQHTVNYFFKTGDWLERTVQANVLIWKNGALTYRLETALPIDEAVQVAESLQEGK